MKGAPYSVFLGLLLAILLVGVAAGEEVSDPTRTNLILGSFETPQLSPGNVGRFSFSLTNPYSWSMNGTTLFVEVYEFSTSSLTTPIEELENAPLLVFPESPFSVGTNGTIDYGMVEADESVGIELGVRTQADTPHGSVFSQGSYFVRFRLEFDFLQDHAVMVSPGFYSLEELDYGLRDPTPEERETYRYVGNANYTFFGEVLGLETIDGMLPDATFGVKEPLPQWPFYTILGGAVAALVLALFYYRRERSDSKAIKRE